MEGWWGSTATGSWLKGLVAVTLRSSVFAVRLRGSVFLGEYLGWHGALSLDYVLQERSGVPVFIDANPCLVEPMNAVFSGVNLANILVRISVGEQISGTQSSPGEVRTHMLLMALLFAGAARASRLDIVYELLRALGKRGLYAKSQEELLPVLRDYISLVPLGYALSRLLIDPKSALALSENNLNTAS
jgi:hypothetical protein